MSTSAAVVPSKPKGLFNRNRTHRDEAIKSGEGNEGFATSLLNAVAAAQSANLPPHGKRLLSLIETFSHSPDPKQRDVATATTDLVRCLSILPERPFRDLLSAANRIRAHHSRKTPAWDALDSINDRIRKLDSAPDHTVVAIAQAELSPALKAAAAKVQSESSPNIRAALWELSNKWDNPETNRASLLTLGMLQNAFVALYPSLPHDAPEYATGMRVPDGEFAEQLAFMLRVSRSSGIPLRNAQLIPGIERDFEAAGKITLYSGEYTEVRLAAQGKPHMQVPIEIVITPGSSGEGISLRYSGISSGDFPEASAATLRRGQSLLFGRNLNIRCLFGSQWKLPEPVTIHPELPATCTDASRAALRISYLENGRILVEDLGGRHPWGYSQTRPRAPLHSGIFRPGRPEGQPEAPDGYTEHL